MDAKDLRIGNHVLANNANEKRFEPYIIKVGRDINNAFYFLPIQLTEEILQKLGFTLESGKGWKHKEFPFYLLESANGAFRYNPKCFAPLLVLIGEVSFIAFFVQSEIKYVHQLQNAWPVLTGKELEIAL